LPDPRTPLIFDGHNDVLLHLGEAGGPAAAHLFKNGRDGHLDRAKTRAGGFAGGFFAIFVPSPAGDDTFTQMQKPAYDLPLPPPMAEVEALPIVLRQMATLYALEQQGDLTVCRDIDSLRAAFASDRLAAVMHIEGAEAIGPDLDALEVFHAAGLRSLGPVWSRANAFGHGATFRYPSSPDTGPGLTDAGRTLVKRCNALKIMVDLSHLTDKGFWDVAAITDAPLVATHSNAHAICPHARNLTDRQLDAIAESDGMVGLNFAAAFLRPDGRMLADVPLDDMLRHLDHLISRLGEDRVGFGSDFDGAVVPQAIDSAAGLPALRSAMTAHGYDAPLMERLCHGNWLRVLGKTWGQFNHPAG